MWGGCLLMMTMADNSGTLNLRLYSLIARTLYVAAVLHIVQLSCHSCARMLSSSGEARGARAEDEKTSTALILTNQQGDTRNTTFQKFSSSFSDRRHADRMRCELSSFSSTGSLMLLCHTDRSAAQALHFQASSFATHGVIAPLWLLRT
jgi:hypothetical protein